MKLRTILIISLIGLASTAYGKVADNAGDSHVIHIEPEYKDAPIVKEVPEAPHIAYEQMSKKDLLIVQNSLCAGYYNAFSIGEMGTVSSLVGLVLKNDFSNDQKLAVRLFTQHSNAYKRMGGVRRDVYDYGGQIGGGIYMGGEFHDGDDVWTKATADDYCARTREGLTE